MAACITQRSMSVMKSPRSASGTTSAAGSSLPLASRRRSSTWYWLSSLPATATTGWYSSSRLLRAMASRISFTSAVSRAASVGCAGW